MIRLATLLMISSVLFGIATFGPFAFLLVVAATVTWAAWSTRREEAC